MEILFTLIAFIFGLVSRIGGFPPLVGYLFAGFALKFVGYESTGLLDILADMGVTLLLFSIGLKLDIKKLIDPSTFLSTTSHLVANTVVFTGILSLFTAISLLSFAELTTTQNLLIAFAASFSSTVCAIKVMGDKGEIGTRHGQLTLSLLVLQDIFAVIFVTIASKKVPSLWAFALLPLPLLRRPLLFLLKKSGHDELLCLVGLLLAFAGGQLFHLVGLKADLGSLLFGMLLANHSKSEELYNAIGTIKELLLISFFLTIGLVASITPQLIATALVLSLILPLKSLLYFKFFTKFHFRARTALLATFNLSNYSEFGLIVAALGYSQGLLPPAWLVILALTISFSFIFSILINRQSHAVYGKHRDKLCRHQTDTILPSDQKIRMVKKEMVVVGMEALGMIVYDELDRQHPGVVCGLDTRQSVLDSNRDEGRKVYCADATNVDFWEQQKLKRLRLVIITTSHLEDVTEISKQLRAVGYLGQIAAIAMHEDEKELLRTAGINQVFCFAEEAGVGYARDAMSKLDVQSI